MNDNEKKDNTATIIPPSVENTETILEIVNAYDGAALEEHLSRLINPIGMIKATLVDLINNVKQYQTTIGAQRSLIETNITKIKSLDTDLKSLQDRKDNLSKEITDAVAAGKKQTDTYVASKRAELSSIDSQFNTTQKELTDAKLDLAENLKKIADSKSTLINLADQIASMSDKLASLNAIEASSQKTINALKDKVDGLTGQFNALADKIDKAEKDLEDTNAEIAAAKKDLKDTVAAIEAAKVELENLKARAFTVTRREQRVREKEGYIIQMYKDAGVTYPQDPSEDNPQ